MNQQELQHFLEKMAMGQQTRDEYKAFTHWMENCSREEYAQTLSRWQEIIDAHESAGHLDIRLIEKIELGLDKIDQREPLQDRQQYPQVERPRYLWPRVAAAASVLLLLSVGAYFLNKKKQTLSLTAKNQTQDIAPGGNKATLTLANGQKIVLDNEKNGIIANQGNAAVNKKADGQLVYDAAPASSSKEVAEAYDTLTTPRSGIYHITLADGSIVWLNTATSIRYPAAFTGKYRTVELLYGEACFEVKHNARNPFLVIAASQTIEDIGTYFNVNAYKDEPSVNTTLLEGSINISKGKQSVILKPGQQARLNENQIKIINQVDVEEVIAWKNGDFIFNENIESIMRKISKWYDVEIIYQKKPDPTLIFWGEISRKKNISAVLTVIERTNNVHFKLEGRRVIVMP